ncbi:hypothetical protein CCACVL1_22018 [Corchorus capsularis]|uniref:BHLH domain-containing protein n=1 Tax=Corchorus capsularis TaxID=210143 RepID=A0A1R3H1C3_COCAP|nr:hypothetical protein CCACVL1_22018 [Corchorus capsularis]
MSDCRSFGSNYYPSSQSRKISVGVMVDSLAKRKAVTPKEDDRKLPNTERTEPSTGISTEEKNRGGVFRKQKEDPEQVKSPWISPRSFHKTLAPETVFCQGETSNSRQKKLNAVKDVPVTYSVQYFPNQTLNVKNVGSHQTMFDGLMDKKHGEKDNSSQKAEEFNFPNAVDKVVLEDKADNSQNVQTETLKMKLQQLFGTVSSPKSQQSISHSPKAGANNLKPEITTADHMGDPVAKRRQNSDTIETDSDNPDKSVKRPVTRSLTRKRAPARVQPAKNNVGLSSKQAHGESIVSFGEGRSTKMDGADNSGSSLSRKRKIQKKNSKINPRKISFHEEDNAVEIQKTTYRSETPLPVKKASSLGKKIESFLGSFSEKRRENFGKVQENGSVHSPVLSEKKQQANFDNPTSPEKGDKQEDFCTISLRNAAYAEDAFQSPTFGFRTAKTKSSQSPTPKTVEKEQGDCSPVPSERGFTIGNIWSFRNFHTPRPVSNKSNSQAVSPDDAEVHRSSSLRNPMPTKEKMDAVDMHSEASSEEGSDSDSECSEEGSPIINRYNCHRENLNSPETVIAEKPKFVHRPIKGLRNHEDVRLGTAESYWFKEQSEQDQEDELTRAVTLFALALETFKRKMDSATTKKSSEILTSVSEEIKLLLQNAGSQIESDVGKLTSLSKTKRKRLETRFQEKQEQLKLILEKFNEDIHNHLLDCRSTVDGMEAHQIELKETMKKQKVSHQKLLMHVEEAVGIQINDAERKITAVHESAREKMLQLKHVVAECLKDTSFSKFLKIRKMIFTANDNRSKDIGVADSTFGSGLTKLDLNNHDKSKMNSYPRSNYAELLSEFYEDHDFSVKQVMDSHVVPAVSKFNSFKQSDDGHGSRKLVGEMMPHLMNSDREVPDDHHHPSSLKQCEVSVPFMRSNSGVEEKRDRVNFSMFLRSGATTRPRSQVPALAEDIFERNIVRSAPRRSSSPSPEQGNLMGNYNTKPILPDSDDPEKEKETLPDDQQSEAVGYNQDTVPPNSRSSKGNIPCDGKFVEQMVGSSSVCSRGASNCPTYTLKTRYDQDTDLSENATEEPEGRTSTKAAPPRGSKGVKKKRKAEVHNLSERKRRDKINKKMRALQELIPNCNKVDKASMLDEAMEYLKTLQLQVQMMSMGSGFFMPPNPMMLHTAMQHMNAQNLIGPYSPMGMRMQMGMGMGMSMGMGMGMGFPNLPGIREARLNNMVGFPGQVSLMSMSPSPFAAARFCPQSVQAPAPAFHMPMQVEQFPVPGVAPNAIPLSTSKDSNTTCQ